MADLRIPMVNERFQTFRTILDGKSVTATVRWNELERFWYLDLDVDGVRVLTGRRMVVGGNLLNAQDMLLGFMEVRTITVNDLSGPGIGGWGYTHQLIYSEAA